MRSDSSPRLSRGNKKSRHQQQTMHAHVGCRWRLCPSTRYWVERSEGSKGCASDRGVQSLPKISRIHKDRRARFPRAALLWCANIKACAALAQTCMARAGPYRSNAVPELLLPDRLRLECRRALRGVVMPGAIRSMETPLRSHIFSRSPAARCICNASSDSLRAPRGSNSVRGSLTTNSREQVSAAAPST